MKLKCMLCIAWKSPMHFAGRSLSTLNSSMVLKNPDIPEAHELRGWYVYSMCARVLMYVCM